MSKLCDECRFYELGRCILKTCCYNELDYDEDTVIYGTNEDDIIYDSDEVVFDEDDIFYDDNELTYISRTIIEYE